MADAEMLTEAEARKLAQHNALPWVEKYRPSKLEELIAHTDIISTVTKLIDEDKLPHLLFYGPPGTGKTSTILACAQRLFGANHQRMTLMLNASDDRGIDVVRDEIKSFASSRTMFSSGFKLIILDEADAMTKTAQDALRRVIEKYTSNVRFCLVCNYVSNIIPALQSRCMRFRFAPLARAQIADRLNHVVEVEKVNIDEGGIKSILKLSEGDMRRCLNILQSTHMAFGLVNEANVHITTGHPLPKDIETIVSWLLNDTFEEAFTRIREMQALKGIALVDVVREVHRYVVRIDFTADVRIFLFDRLSEIEHRLAMATGEKLQVAALVGAFVCARKMIADATAANAPTMSA